MQNLLKSGVRGLAVASVLGLAVSAVAQQSGQPDGSEPQTAAAREQAARYAEMLRDFNHFVRINRADVAAGYAKQILTSGITPVELVELVESVEGEERFRNSIGRAMQMPELEGMAAALVKMYDRGRMERVRDPQEITRNIGLLSGVQRAQMLGRERLAAAGEYAMPQLLAALLQRNDVALQAEARSLLVNSMGQHAIIPLATALPNLDAASQELVADVLGLIGYRTALPFLFDVMLSTESQRVRVACDRAVQRIGVGSSVDVAELYQQLGEGYYARHAELISFPGEEHQLLWTYMPGLGLSMTAIRTEVYNEAMAMRMAERSLELRPQGNDGAVSLWLASNFSREIRTPEGYENPAYTRDRDAMYFAVVAGAGPSQSVLARALDKRDTPLARQAIAAIEQTAGGAGLWSSEGDRRALLEALRYPSRRVQYEAALALGRAQPKTPFEGAERVVPLLASAIRDAGVQYAAVVSTNRELADWTRQALEKAGYRVLPVGARLNDLAEAIAEVPGVDLIVSHLSPDATVAMVSQARTTPKLGATPILAVTAPHGAIDLTRRYMSDAAVEVRPAGLNEEQLVLAAEEVVEIASGGRITDDEARGYSERSLSVLRDLAISGSEVLDVGDAALSLMASLGETQGEERLRIAEVLSRIDQKRVQVALMDAALSARGEEQVILLAKVAGSAKRFGNLLEGRQVKQVIELAEGGGEEEATAAAALIGSLNLTNNNLVPLILGSRN